VKSLKQIITIDFCNYEDYPIGGYLTFAKNMMSSFENELALVGITTNKHDPIGSWFKKEISGIEYDYFAFAYYSKLRTKHILPDRLVSYLLVKYYFKKISQIDIPNVFVRRPEIMLSIKKYTFLNICFCFAGVENPLLISKYWYSKFIAGIFEKKFFESLVLAKTILAAGDENAIRGMIQRSNGIILRNKVIQFPTRISTDVFRPLNKNIIREKLNISKKYTIIVTTGRLSWLKGWKFMIDCFSLFEKKVPDSLFYFIGDGEDLHKIEEYIVKSGLINKVILVGRKNSIEIAEYLNASDLFIMGSYKEGWSTSLMEAIACGIPACVTNFSSAKEIILEGLNGHVIEDHNIDIFVKGMIKTFNLVKPVNNENIKAFATNRLKEDILKIWKLQ
jgi:glycosyltransferase involved in cell wall biosynthesis